MSKKTIERPVFPFTGIVGQEEICDFTNTNKLLVFYYLLFINIINLFCIIY